MNKFAYIGTWRMSYAGMISAKSKDNGDTLEFIKNAISHIEDFEFFKSVGYGGLPNEDGKLQFDAGFMDGKTKDIGAVMAVSNISNPIQLAIKLSKYKYNRMLAGEGAYKWAIENNFKKKVMETDRCLDAYKRKMQVLSKNNDLSPYDGHDTVCFVGTNKNDQVISATSTSGLFMKKQGRVGDSPLTGAGFYADSNIGGASATGLGEDITRGVLSVRVVDAMKYGLSPHDAANKVLFEFSEDMLKRNEKIGPISIISMDNKGNWGVATNCLFQFSIYNDEMKEPKLFISNLNPAKNGTVYEEVKKGYWEEYLKSLENPISI